MHTTRMQSRRKRQVRNYWSYFNRRSRQSPGRRQEDRSDLRAPETALGPFEARLEAGPDLGQPDPETPLDLTIR